MSELKKHNRLELFENGLDFVESGVNYILDDSNQAAMKYAVLHLSAGVELILKNRLFIEDWRLIFQNEEKANETSLRTGNFKSVFFESIIDKLEIECGVNIDVEAKDSLKKLRNIRNRFEHFEVNEATVVIKSISAEVLSFLLTFIGDEFDSIKFSQHAQMIIGNLRELLKKFREFERVRLKQLTPRLEKERCKYTIVECPVCRHETFVVDGNTNCLFCTLTGEPEDMAQLYVENVMNISAHVCTMDGGTFPVYNCPNCDGYESYVDTKDGFLCFACGEYDPEETVQFCESCGEPFIDNNSSRCSDCLDAIWSKDN